MRTPRLLTVLSALCLLSSPLGAATATDTVDPDIKSTAKPWTRWWWLGSAVDQKNLTRELEAIAAAGFGGVEITPIYGAKGYESRFLPFLSPSYMQMLAHVTSEAQRLGLGVDMATGTGWPFGGPWVTAADVELKLDLSHGQLEFRPTGFKVKRSAPGGEGFVLNPYSSTAMTHYLEPFTAALSSLPAGALRSQFHDSFEYTANWAREVPEKFLAMHGYALMDHVAELRGEGDPDSVARVKADYRTTLGQLHLEFLQTWTQWAHAHGQLARDQAHGSPGNLLDLYGSVDIPETEIFGSHNFPIPGFRRDAGDFDRPAHPPGIHRFASSAAHVMGRPLVSSESFTWLREHFREAPSQMKPEVDRLFLAGINHVFYHGDAYSPADAPWPGWLFYASSQFNTRNPLWTDFAGLNAYIARCQVQLQSGNPDNDILVYWPIDDLWHDPKGLTIQLTVHADWLGETACGQLMSQLSKEGYAHDLISDAQLQNVRAQKGALETHGSNYKTLLIPRTQHMNPATLEQIVALAQAGASVIFLGELPADVPGLGQLSERRARLKAVSDSLHFTRKSPGLSEAQIGQGRVLLTQDASMALSSLQISRETSSDNGIELIRRHLPVGTTYFVVNTGAKEFAGWITLAARETFSSPTSIVNPLNGEIHPALTRKTQDGVQVFLQLTQGESVLMLPVATEHSAAGQQPSLTAAGKPVPIFGPWQVTFLRGGPELPPPFSETALASWTAQGNGAENFAGTARYETTLSVPANSTTNKWRLELGDVRETARVFVNDREVALLWSLPFRTNVSAYLHSGENKLAIEVTNLAANRIRDLDRRKVAWKNFHEINFVDIRYKPFDASNWTLQPSGLLGPVQLVPLKEMTPEK